MAVIYVQTVGMKYKSSLPVPLEALGDAQVVKVLALKEQVCAQTRITPVKQRMEYKGRAGSSWKRNVQWGPAGPVAPVLLEMEEEGGGDLPVCYALANGELALAYYLLSEAGNHRERQVKMAREHRLEVIDYCEEFTGANEADQLREAFASGLAGPEDAAARPERPEKSV
eukprot:g23896.t2